LWLETLKLVPQLAWVLVGAYLLFLFAGPILRTLEQGNITKLGVGVVQIEVAQKQIHQAATAQKQEIPIGLKARIERAPRTLFDAAILWLDDNPSNHVVERRAFASLGLTVDTARTTAEALTMLYGGRYHIIISDFVRKEAENTPCLKPESSEDTGGCNLISQLNRSIEKENRGRTTERARPPVIFFARVFTPESGTPPYSFGATSQVDELFHLVLDALERRSIKL
jgi:CheY-like chemotaxis protein